MARGRATSRFVPPFSLAFALYPLAFQHYGRLTGRGSFRLFIIIVSLPPGGDVFTFTFPRCICRRISSGLGMPGVGVAPGLNGFLKVAGSGIPGVGVAPFGMLFASRGSGMPGVLLPDGAIGLVDNPGGRLFASTFTLPVPTAELEFALAFESADPHAETMTSKVKIKTLRKTFDINSKTSSNLK
jgi:hypothetical protein